MRITDKRITEKIICGEIVKLTNAGGEIYLTKDNYFDVLDAIGERKFEDWEMITDK